jgi:DNA-binding NarL/FixJ family response regulator
MSTDAAKPPAKLRILIVDDHPIVRHGYLQLINREPDMVVCAQAETVKEALSLAQECRPDVAIVDLSLNGEDGMELIDYLKSNLPDLKILVSSTHDEQTFAGRVLRAGARGYISKKESLSKIVEAIRQVMGGEIYLSPHMMTILLQLAAVGKSLDLDPVKTLSDREIQVFRMIGEGLSTVQIAGKMLVSPKTVESHRKLIKMKLNLQNSMQLSRAAFRWVQEGH